MFLLRLPMPCGSVVAAPLYVQFVAICLVFVPKWLVGPNVESVLLFEHAVFDLLLSSYYLRIKLSSSQ